MIIADGFYEWRLTPGGRKQPLHITRDDHEPFAFAGLWSIWHADEQRTLRSCTILTTSANSAIAPLHDRMPVILAPGHEPDWLDLDAPSERLDELLTGLPARHTALTEVGFAVNDVRNDGPECLTPVPSATRPAGSARQQVLLSCRSTACGAVRQPHVERGGVHRGADVEPLGEIAAQQREALERRRVLDALGGDPQPEVVAEVDRRPDHDQVAL